MGLLKKSDLSRVTRPSSSGRRNRRVRRAPQQPSVGQGLCPAELILFIVLCGGVVTHVTQGVVGHLT